MFERREQIIEIGVRLLRACHLPDNERHLFAVRCRNSRLPFAVAAIEHKDRGAFGQAQHIADIICLQVIKLDSHPSARGALT